MATDWVADVKKYAPNADDGIIGGIVRYCGIALRNRDSSLVSFSDPTELARVRNNFLKKKLGLTHADSVLDAAIAKVGETMKADRTKNRVTVYYLLADAYKSLHLFEKKGAAKAAAKAPAKAAPKAAKVAAGAAGVAALASLDGTKKKAPAKKPAAKKAAAPKAAAAKTAAPKVAAPAPAPAPAPAAKSVVAPVAAAAVAATAAGAAALSSAASGAADTAAKVGGAAVGTAGTAATAAAAKVSGTAQGLAGSSDDGSEGGLGWLWILLGLALLTFFAWWLFNRKPDDDAAVGAVATETTASDAAAAGAAATDLSSAPAEGTATIPAGAGVTSETRDGKPVVKVYFDTGKTDVAPAFADTAGGLKAWLDGHAGSTLAVSGYNDPTGNAARNAQLSKNRAKAVAADLIKAGIPETSVALVKPEASTDANVPKEAARRVEVTVQ